MSEGQPKSVSLMELGPNILSRLTPNQVEIFTGKSWDLHSIPVNILTQWGEVWDKPYSQFVVRELGRRAIDREMTSLDFTKLSIPDGSVIDDLVEQTKNADKYPADPKQFIRKWCQHVVSFGSVKRGIFSISNTSGIAGRVIHRKASEHKDRKRYYWFPIPIDQLLKTNPGSLDWLMLDLVNDNLRVMVPIDDTYRQYVREKHSALFGEPIKKSLGISMFACGTSIAGSKEVRLLKESEVLQIDGDLASRRNKRHTKTRKRHSL